MTPTVLFGDAVAPAAAGWLLTYAIHSTILLGLATLVGLRLREQHAWLEWTWKVALIGAVATTTVQSAVRVEPLGGRWTPWPATAGGSQPSSTAGAPLGAVEDGVMASGGAAESAAGTSCCGSEAAAGATNGRRVAAFVSGSVRGAVGFVRSTVTPLLVGSWLLLALLALGRFGRRQRALYRVLAGRRPVHDAYVTDVLAELSAAGGLRRTPRLTMTARCPVPVALLGGEIVLPDRFLTDLDREQQRAALAHEVAHQMRCDPRWLLLVHVLEAVFFFQPLQRRARVALRESAEVLCDDWAVQQTVSLGVARCLAAVAEWVSPAAEWQLTAASGMACNESALVRRVDRVLRRQRVQPTRRALAVATLLPLPLLLVVAPVVSRADIPASPTLHTRAANPSRLPRMSSEQPAAPAPPAEDERVARQERVIRTPRPSDPLAARWKWAQDEAARRGLRGFWVVYSFHRPVSRDPQFISDSHGVNFTDQLFRLPPLSTVLDQTSPIGGRGTIGALFHFTGADDRRIDRIGHRSMSVGMDFAGEPVFWLGYAEESESLAQLEGLFASVPALELRAEVVETYGIHPTTDRVLPFLTRALRAEMPEKIRAEAAESLEHHDDARVVALLVRTAQTDASIGVRAEAAEALGGVHVPAAIPALVDLAKNGSDVRVRAEAAEALGDQVPERALPALEQVINTSADRRIQLEAVEALGSLNTREAVAALVRLIWQRGSPDVQRQAVETLADHHEFGIIEHLDRILVEHDDEHVLEEALDVLADLNDPRAAQRIARAARSARSPRVRREALQLLGDAQQETKDRAGTLSADELAALLERAIFEDADRSVQLEALEVAAESLPRAAARRLLRRVADDHPDRGVREEALELLDDIG